MEQIPSKPVDKATRSLSLSLPGARQRKQTLTESSLLFLKQNLSLSIRKQPLYIKGIFDELRAPSKQLIIIDLYAYPGDSIALKAPSSHQIGDWRLGY
uniref:Uncharacterized protein n=1 Tax=Salix viminalis TaxID=40686 RepID=A0A6N2KM52_SALVM